MNNKIAIGVLAYNVEDHIEKVLLDLVKFNLPIYVVNDASSDNTSKILMELVEKTQIDLDVINNKSNLGAGESTKILIKTAKSENFNFLIKVDGDGQFIKEDIKRIIKLAESTKYDFIKSNRFWEGGIRGNIPKVRFFGNLVATLFLQIICGTNKLYDPLNGLFGVSLEIEEKLKDKNYPKRYGYPFFVTITAIINGYRTYQINNTVNYEGQSSNLNSVRVFITIIKLSIIFYVRKLKIKKNIGAYQRSAFFDILFLVFSFLSIFSLIELIYISFYAETSIISTQNLLIIFILILITTVFIFVLSFREERPIRNEYIDID